jgi:hypothetical protein
MTFIRNLCVYIFFPIFVSSCTSTGPETFGVNFFDGEIKKGMTLEEVQAYLGTPNRTDSVSKGNEGMRAWTFLFQAPTSEGKYIFKELTVVFRRDVVELTNYRERFLLKPERDVRMSNRVIEIR